MDIIGFKLDSDTDELLNDVRAIIEALEGSPLEWSLNYQFEPDSRVSFTLTTKRPVIRISDSVAAPTK